MVEQNEYIVVALQRGLKIMQHIAYSNDGGISLSALADRVDMPTPTVLRYVRTLEAGGFVERDEHKRYRPGIGNLTLGFATLEGMNLLQLARLPLQRLAAETGQTVNLGVLVDSNVLYLHRLKNQDLITADVRIGSSLPAVCTSLGKALLATLSDDEIRALITGDELSHCGGPNAHDSIESLLSDMAATRDRGWSIADQEIFAGLRSIGRAITRRDGQTIGAINVAVLADKWSMDDLIDTHLSSLLDCASEIAGTTSTSATAKTF